MGSFFHDNLLEQLLHFGLLGPSINYATLFLTNFDPLPLSRLVTPPGSPLKYVTHLGRPRFLVEQKTWTKTPCPVQSISQWFAGFLFGGFVRGFLSGRFCPGWFLSIPLFVRIPPLQQKVNHQFQCHVSYV